MSIPCISWRSFYVKLPLCQTASQENLSSGNQAIVEKNDKIFLIINVIVLLAAIIISKFTTNIWDSNLHERVVDIDYRFKIQEIPNNTKEILVWLPVPPTNSQQILQSIYLEDNLSYEILTEGEYGNRFIYMDLSKIIPQNANEITISATFRVRRKPYPPLVQVQETSPVSKTSLSRFLAPDRLIPIDGIIAAEARHVAGKKKESLPIARQLFYHIVDSVTYDKKGMGWGRGDALYACTVRTGNCTDFHSLFIGEARSMGIPARFVMGLPLPKGLVEGRIPGYHCWAEFYVRDKGWIPLDASEASKFRHRKEEFFSGLDANRIEFTTGRDIKLPRSSYQPLNYIIYPHVEIDGHPYTKVKTDFYFYEQ